MGYQNNARPRKLLHLISDLGTDMIDLRQDFIDLEKGLITKENYTKALEFVCETKRLISIKIGKLERLLGNINR